MLRPTHFFPNYECALQKPVGFCVSAGVFVEHVQIVEDGRNARVLRSKCLFANSLSSQQRALVIVHHLTQQSERAGSESTEPRVFPEPMACNF